MSKHFWLPLSLLAGLALPARAQRKQESFSPWWIGFTAGPAIPTGSFARLSNDIGPGSVDPGIGAELSLGYRLLHRFSLNAVLGGQMNKGYALPFQQSTEAYNAPGITKPDHHWKIARLLAGGIYTVPIPKVSRVQVFFRALGGVQKTQSADYIVSYTSPPSAGGLGPREPQYMVSKNYSGLSLPWAFAWQGDAGIQCRLTGGLYLQAGAGYSSSRAHQSVVDALAFNRDGSVEENETVTQKIHLTSSTFHINFGLTYFFRK